MAMVIVQLLNRRTASRKSTLPLGPRKSLGTSAMAVAAKEAVVEAEAEEMGEAEEMEEMEEMVEAKEEMEGAKEAEALGTVQGHRSKSWSSRIAFHQG